MSSGRCRDSARDDSRIFRLPRIVTRAAMPLSLFDDLLFTDKYC